MSRPGFADRSKLAAWADSVPSQTEFPRLIRRLILETAPGLVELGMPAGEGVAAGGWDGSARSTAHNAWVPDGLSVWELSVKKNTGAKADEDYGKRSSPPDGSATDQCVYVEAILRPWTKRAEWARERTDEGKWKAVRAYGLDDIETWLETAPVTWAWFSELVRLSPYGLRSAEAWWDAWSNRTNPAISAEVVLAGREKNVELLLGRLAAPQLTTISGPSLDEIQAFIASTAVRAASQGDGQLLARTAFVDDLATWRSLLASSSTPLVLVPVVEGLADELPSGCIHHIVVPVSGVPNSDIDLEPLDSGVVATALAAAGVSDDRRADDLGRLARRSLTALRRSLAAQPALHRPSWASTPVARPIRAALLAGSWADANDGDRSVMSELAGEEYDRFRELLAPVADVQDPVVLLLGASWHLVSAYDAWLLLRKSITPDDLLRLESAVRRVLGEDDPALDLPEEDRWKASLDGKVRAFSASLRRGLANTLALLGTHGDEITGPSGSTGSSWAGYLVRSLLTAANDDATGRTWASLATELPLLAEAAPQQVVDAMRAATSGADPLAEKWFADLAPGGIFGGDSPHTHVLWALERLAWSTDQFGAVVDILARLEELDPGGRTSNRPFNSLSEIFCPWHPENAATSNARLAAIDGLRSRHNPVAWRLLLSMLPDFQGVHMPTAEPKYRDWKPEEKGVPRVEYFAFIRELVDRAVAEAAGDAGRWHELLTELSNLPPDDRALVVDGLRSVLDAKELSDDATGQIWKSLTKLIAQHQEFADAAWALPQTEIAELEALGGTLAPTDPYLVNLSLFLDYMPHLKEGRWRDDHDAYQDNLAHARRHAVVDIEDAEGLDAVRRLSKESKVRGAVGWALGQAVGDKYRDQLLPDLSSADDASADLASSYLGQRISEGGWPWLTDLLKARPDLVASQKAQLLLLTRDFPKAWEEADRLGAPVAEQFWQRMMPYGLGTDFGQVAHAAERMMDVGRNARALDFIGLYMKRDGSDQPDVARLAVKGLIGLLGNMDDPDLRSLSSWDWESLFQLIEQHREVIGLDEVGRLEWAFLPALGYDPEVPTLHSQMADDPAFFLEILSTVYQRQTTEPDVLSEAEETQRQARATNGYRLLSSWGVPPGLVSGAIDQGALTAWVDESLELLATADRVDIGLNYLGQALASAPPDTDDLWPPLPVRDLFERLQSTALEGGFSTQIFNRRGVTSRGLEEGGTQEEALAAKYTADAEAFKDGWPRTAAILRGLAISYSSEARRNDTEAERFRQGLAR
jgi:hypothetical protein